MKKRIVSLGLLLVMLASLVGCKNNDEVIVSNEESTIIKTTNKVDSYVNQKDFNSIAYAYIYNIKSGLDSYISETTGSLKAKVLFLNYDVDTYSTTIKRGDTFYSHDKSNSLLSNYETETYQIDNTKTVYTKDVKEYKVYAMDEFHKISYSVDQYLILGYVFNDSSILKSELIKNQGGEYSVKYTLDNDKSTTVLKNTLKVSGELTELPKFQNIEITLTMKNDFTPVSYSLNSTYEAAKPLLGSSVVTQTNTCVFSKINEEVTIENESFYQEKLGLDPSKVVVDEESSVKNELIDAAKALVIGNNGVNVDGELYINFGQAGKVALTIETSTLVKIANFSTDNIFNALNLHAKVVGNDTMNSLIALISTFMGDKLGEYKDLLSSFKGLEVFFPGDGTFYLAPFNADDKFYFLQEIKVLDMISPILSKINLSSLLNGNTQEDLVNFKKVNILDEDNYDVSVILTDKAKELISEKIPELLSLDPTGIVQALLEYESFDSLLLLLGVRDAKLSAVNIKINYVNTSQDVVTLLGLDLESKDLSYDFNEINKGIELAEAKNGIQALLDEFKFLEANFFASNGYVNRINKALSDYEELSDDLKLFFNSNTIDKIKQNLNLAKIVIDFMNVYNNFDKDNPTNKALVNLVKASEKLGSDTIKAELGDDYDNFKNFGTLVNFDIAKEAIKKMTSDDHNTWNLTSEEILDLQNIITIGQYFYDVQDVLKELLTEGGVTLSYYDFKTAISELVESISD